MVLLQRESMAAASSVLSNDHFIGDLCMGTEQKAE
jgi:hypothetical protein